MRALCTGSRSWRDQATIVAALTFAHADLLASNQRASDLVIVHGACPTGADAIVDRVARELLGFTVERHPADWSQGRGAGFARNDRMVKLGADLCLAFWDGRSRGTLHTITQAVLAGIPVRIFPEATP